MSQPQLKPRDRFRDYAAEARACVKQLYRLNHTQQTLDFVDLHNLDIIGLYPDYKTAEKAWRAAAQRTVDDAEMKYVVVHLHKLLQPDAE